MSKACRPRRPGPRRRGAGHERLPPAHQGGRLDRLRFAPEHARLLVGSGVGWALDAMDVGLLISDVMTALAAQWGLSNSRLGWIGSIGFVGMMIGASVGGLLVDRLGRRTVFALILLIHGIATGAAALSVGVGMLIVLRLVVGIGLGAEPPVASTLVSEFAPGASAGAWWSGSRAAGPSAGSWPPCSAASSCRGPSAGCPAGGGPCWSGSSPPCFRDQLRHRRLGPASARAPQPRHGRVRRAPPGPWTGPAGPRGQPVMRLCPIQERTWAGERPQSSHSWAAVCRRSTSRRPRPVRGQSSVRSTEVRCSWQPRSVVMAS